MAAEAANAQPESAPQEAPNDAVAEAPQEAPAAEHWTKKPFEGGSLGAAEKAAEMRGLGKMMEEKAEAETEKFGEETKSLWGRVKERLFKKKEDAPVKGEAEVLEEIAKADAVFANFRKEMARIMAHGGEADLRALEGSLSAAYDQLAPKVAAEGAAESDAMRKALKTGEMPQVTETGAKLNYINKRLADVREKLAGGKFGTAEALAAANAAAQEQAIAEAPVAPHAATPEAKPSPEDRLAAEREFLLKGGKLKDGTVVKGAEGLPGERMIDEYLKVRELNADSYGEIVGRSFDPVKGEIRLTYEDGGQLRSYASGMKLRVHPGGKVEEINARKERIAEMGARVDAAMAAEDAAVAEGTDENPILLTSEMRTGTGEEEIFDDAEKAALAKGAQRPEAAAEDRESLLEAARAKAEELLRARDARFAVSIENLRVSPDDPSLAPYSVRALRISHQDDPKMGWTMEVAEESADALARLEKAIQKTYDEKTAARGSVVSGEIEAKPAAEAPQEDLAKVVVAKEAGGAITSEQAPVAAGEIENKTVLQKTKTSEDAVTAAGEIEVEDTQIISEAPAAEAPPAAPEAISVEPGDDLRMTPAAKVEAAPEAPVEELTPEKIAKAKKEPLAPASLPAIVETLRTKGKAGDGKFATPASFLQALETAGFAMPADMEADEPKKLHEAYKKALKARK